MAENYILFGAIVLIAIVVIVFLIVTGKQRNIDEAQANFNNQKRIQAVGDYNKAQARKEWLADRLEEIEKEHVKEARLLFSEQFGSPNQQSLKDIYNSLKHKYDQLKDEARKASEAR